VKCAYEGQALLEFLMEVEKKIALNAEKELEKER
jgi:hypothetical protein